MNKWLLRFTSLLVIVALLGACSSDDNNGEATSSGDQATETETETNGAADEQKEETVVITISEDEGAEIIDEKEVPIKDGAILMDVMEENFTLEADFDGGYITSIDGLAQNEEEQKGWIFSVNGEMAMVGAKELELSPGDKVTFDLQAWE